MNGTIAQSSNQLVVCDRFTEAFDQRDPFEAMLAQEGDVVREAPGRRTLRFTSNGRSYFAKIHTGVGWREIIKNVARLRWPVVSAADEWRAIQRVRELGIRTANPVAFGRRGRNPARLQSFIVTEDLGDTITLAALANRWQDRPAEIDVNSKRRLVNEVARIARTLHANGINHRDFYLCHFRVDRSAVDTPGQDSPSDPYLMDLHRAQIRRHVPRRWLIKDLASLLFSSFDAPIEPRDVLRFVRAYRGDRLRDSMTSDEQLWRQVVRRAVRMYRTHHGGRHPRLDIDLRKRRSWK